MMSCMGVQPSCPPDFYHHQNYSIGGGSTRNYFYQNHSNHYYQHHYPPYAYHTHQMLPYHNYQSYSHHPSVYLDTTGDGNAISRLSRKKRKYKEKLRREEQNGYIKELAKLVRVNLMAQRRGDKRICLALDTDNSRLNRNKAEKNRRDKLNARISELASLVPLVSTASKKVDKTSILRLTVTHLRMHNILIPGTDTTFAFPNPIEKMDLSKFVLDELESIMLVVTSAGKIIFVSHTVEQILGHSQLELLGQCLYKITYLEDHAELKKNLKPDEPYTSIAGSETQDDSCSESSRSSSVSHSPSPAASSSGTSFAPPTTGHLNQRRSFYLRLSKRASRGDQPQYELVHVIGHLRVPPRGNISSPSSKKSKDQPLSSNDVVLVAMIRPYKEKRITSLSLLEATKDEYITRHLVDGTIIYTDHRISLVAGYLADEVTGITGFQYMHKDDVRWTMVGLRQMYNSGESYGWSCYRLQSKTGEFIYLRTHGHLEVGKDDTVQSFICINCLVSEKEGERLIKEMKARYSPLIQEKEPGIQALAVNNMMSPDGFESDTSDSFDKKEDPVKLKDCIKQLISSLPADAAVTHRPHSPAPDTQFRLLSTLSKNFPPASLQSAQFGINAPVVRFREEEPSPPPQPATPVVRQTVLRMSRASHSDSDNGASVLKRIRTEDGVYNRDIDSNRDGVVVTMAKPGSKRVHSTEQLQSISPSYQHQDLHPPMQAASMHQQADQYANMRLDIGMESASDTFGDSRNTPEELMPQYSQLQCPMEPTTSMLLPGQYDDVPQTTELNGYRDWSVVHGVVQTHQQLETSMQHQANTLNNIAGSLVTAPEQDPSTLVIRESLTMLQKTHEQQQELLRALKKETHTIQQDNWLS